MAQTEDPMDGDCATASAEKSSEDRTAEVCADDGEVEDATQDRADDGEMEETTQDRADDGEMQEATQARADDGEMEETTQARADDGEIEEATQARADDGEMQEATQARANDGQMEETTHARADDGEMEEATQDFGSSDTEKNRDVLTQGDNCVATKVPEFDRTGELQETGLASSDLNGPIKAEEHMHVEKEGCEFAIPNQKTKDEPVSDGGAVDSLAAVVQINMESDDNRRLSLKRCRSYFDNTPSVQVIYKYLTSESKKKLIGLLQQWAEWHGRSVSPKDEADKECLESGDEMYFPALQVGGESKSTVSFWMDKPSKQARTENDVLDSMPGSQDREKEVPLYNRAGTGALISQEMEISMEGCLEYPSEDSRCFNCGSYSHSVKECPRPRDNAAINNARKLLSEKRGSGSGPRTTSRYYQSSPGGKFDDLKPGILGIETRQSLGIGDLDPPPWLNRMRELGYPPGYIEDQEDEPSGITIFGASEEGAGVSYIGEDGELIESRVVVKRKSVGQKMKVSFPGVNAPIPDEADKHIWASPADSSDYGHSAHRSLGRRTGFSSSYSATALTSDGIVYTGTGDWVLVSNGPPGSGQESLLRSPKVWSPSIEGAGVPKGSPGFQNELGRSGKGASTGSPYLGRSASDSGRSRPRVAYDDSHLLPPLAGPSRQSPRSYHSPFSGAPLNPSPSQRMPHGQEFREDMSEGRWRAWAQAQDALTALHHHERYPHSRR